MNNIYDTNKIANRIYTERRALKLSQQELADALNISARQTIAKWENGTVIPQLEDMLNMCNLFDCELGYLLGEHELKTRTATDIHQITGLSSESIAYLETANFEAQRTPKDNFDTDPASCDIKIRTINFLLERHSNSPDSYKYNDLLSAIADYLYGNFLYYYDDNTVSYEDLYVHIEMLGLWDKMLGTGASLQNETLIANSIMTSIQEKLLHAREYIQKHLPQRITPPPKPLPDEVIDNIDWEYAKKLRGYDTISNLDDESLKERLHNISVLG